jgi:dynein heavy chain 1
MCHLSNPFYLITAIYSGICFVTNLNFGNYSAIEIKLAQIAKYRPKVFINLNFVFQLSKEVRNLKNLGFRVPLAIVNKAHQANQLYPFAISLIESIRTYERSLEKLEQRTAIVILVGLT